MFAGYKQPCTKSQECSHIEGANCTDNRTCECEAEMVLSEDGKKCLPAVKHIQDECTESVQCMTFQHSLCVEKMCRCQENFHFEHNMTKCFPNKGTHSFIYHLSHKFVTDFSFKISTFLFHCIHCFIDVVFPVVLSNLKIWEILIFGTFRACCIAQLTFNLCVNYIAKRQKVNVDENATHTCTIN